MKYGRPNIRKFPKSITDSNKNQINSKNKEIK